MKIAVAQVRPVVGAVERNLDRHLALTTEAVRLGATFVLFPELSLLGYEPRLAEEYARLPGHASLSRLQLACDHHAVSIGVGMARPTAGLPQIATYLFRPRREPLVYAKMHLHEDEKPFFQPGINSSPLIHTNPPVALAICYELSVADHAANACQAGAKVYVASVAKTAAGVLQASARLARIAADFKIHVLMSNCLGLLDGAECAGTSTVWNCNGQVIARLEGDQEGMIVLDSESGKAVMATA